MILSLSHQTLWNLSVPNLTQFASEHFNGVELVDEPRLHTWELRHDTDKIRDQLSTTSLRVTLHATYRDLNLASMNQNVRDLSISEIKKSLEIAGKLNAKVVTIHPGKLSGRKFARGQSLSNLCDSLSKIIPLSNDYGIPLSIENQAGSPKKLCQTPHELLSVIKQFDNVGATLDLSHVYMLSLNPRSFLSALDSKLFNVHISDYNLGSDHLQIGSGIMNFEQMLELLSKNNYKKSVVLEAIYPKNPQDGVIGITKLANRIISGLAD